MVNGWWAGTGLPSSLSALEQREVDHPQEVEAALGHGWPAELEAQQAEHVADDRPVVGHQQQQVAGLGANALA